MSPTKPDQIPAGFLEGSSLDIHVMVLAKRRELAVFIFLTLVLAPLLAVTIVAGYGFCVWMYQLVAGPPGV